MELELQEGDSFEYALVFSLISRRSIRLPLRAGALADKQRCFLGLVMKLTAKSSHRIADGAFLFTPGTIRGGPVSHATKHSVSHHIVHALPLVAFSRLPIKVRLTGVTNSSAAGESIDAVKAVHAKIAAQLGVSVEIKIVRRGFFPGADGEVVLQSEPGAAIKSVTRAGDALLGRIVGIAYSARIGSDTVHRAINEGRDQLKAVCPSIKFYADVGNRSTSGASPGWGLLLVADGAEAVYYAEGAADGGGAFSAGGRSLAAGSTPEEAAALVARALLRSIRRGGAFDHKAQSWCLALLALGDSDVSRVRVSRIDRAGRAVLRMLRDFFGYTYKIDASDGALFLKSYGVGHKNIYKVMQ